jgi:DNA-binding beta-propeller fold protein YncE
MRRFVHTVIAMVALTSLVFGAEETFFGGEVEHGGFGGPVFKLTQMNGEMAYSAGGRGGWIINHAVSIGGGGFGMTGNHKVGVNEAGEDLYLHAGYGGLIVEYISNSNDRIHTAYSVLIGAGGANVSTDRFGDAQNVDEQNSDAFFVIEPEVHMDFNMTRWFRIGVGAGYRLVSGLDMDLVSNSDLSGPSVMLTLKFGKF